MLISLNDSENILKAMETTGNKSGIPSTQNVEMAIYFDLTKAYLKSNLKFVLSVDDYRSYDLIIQFLPYY